MPEQKLGRFPLHAWLAWEENLAIEADAPQAFVKFLGERDGKNSIELSRSIIKVVEDIGCHLFVSYPNSQRPRRPRQPKDGDIIFISYLTKNPNDIRIFGCARAEKHVEGRDDATTEDIARRPWREKYSIYIRLYDAEFINGTLENGVSLYEMMDELESDSFASTQRNEMEKNGKNTNPRQAYNSKPHVKLSKEGFEWIREKLLVAFKMHGKIPQDKLDKFD